MLIRELNFAIKLSRSSSKRMESESGTHMLNMENKSMWYDAYFTELRSLEDSGLRVVRCPSGAQILSQLELFSTKYDAVNGVIKAKCRFAARGDQEKVENSLFAPVASGDLIRTTLAIMLQINYPCRQLDIKTAFLNGRRKEPFYVRLPLGHEERDNGRNCWKSYTSIYDQRMLRIYGVKFCRKCSRVLVYKETFWSLVYG